MSGNIATELISNRHERKSNNRWLLDDCTRYFEQNCYTRHRIERYKSMWRNGICHYMETSGITNYDRCVGEEFIHTRISASVTPAERDLIRSVSVLTQMQETGKVSKRTVHPIIRELTGPIGEAMESLQLSLERTPPQPNDYNDIYCTFTGLKHSGKQESAF